MRCPLLVLASLCLLTGRAIAEPSALEHVSVFMTGTFSNADQARGDRNFRHVTLQIAPVWTDRTDGPWLYLEQALVEAPTHPYRQIVYQLVARANNEVEIRPFELRDPLAATGAWRDPALLAKFSPVDLISRTGCASILRLQPNSTFQGGTEGKGCASDLRGATYSTTELTITSQQLTTWERGYNSAGTQVWGSIHGGTLFKKTE